MILKEVLGVQVKVPIAVEAVVQVFENILGKPVSVPNALGDVNFQDKRLSCNAQDTGIQDLFVTCTGPL